MKKLLEALEKAIKTNLWVEYTLNLTTKTIEIRLYPAPENGTLGETSYFSKNTKASRRYLAGQIEADAKKS